jgi:hypothetical protein
MGSKASTFSIACCMFNQKCPQRPRLAPFVANNRGVRRRDEMSLNISSELFLLMFSAERCSCAKRRW